MRVYENVEETLNEWSRILRLRRTNSIKETLDIWSKRLAERYSRPFIVRASAKETLNEWSKII